MISGDKLKAAAQEGDINLLYQLIQEDPHVLERVDSTPFVETPLHVAASAGHLHFAIETMRLKPSFALKLDPQGFTPIHLALGGGYNMMVLEFVKNNKELVRVRGREGLTPLHFASKTGEMELLTKFFKACPESINDVTVRNETALHIAEKYGNWEALKFLNQWLETNVDLEETMLNWKDEEGNTVLHIAAYNNDIKAIALLTKVSMDIDAKNLEGRTALDIATEDIKKSLNLKGRRNICMSIRTIDWKISSMKDIAVRYFGLRQHISTEECSMYLVVATLVATATYQAALSPPGGIYQSEAETHNNTLSHVHDGKSIMPNIDFIAFSMTNMIAFMTSIMITFFLLPKTTALIPLSGTIFLLLVSYYTSMEVISPTPLAKWFVEAFCLPMLASFVYTCLTTIINFLYKVILHQKIYTLEKLHT